MIALVSLLLDSKDWDLFIKILSWAIISGCMEKVKCIIKFCKYSVVSFIANVSAWLTYYWLELESLLVVKRVVFQLAIS